VPLRFVVEPDHSFGKRISVGFQHGNPLKHRSVKGAVDLLERFGSGEVDQDERAVPQEAVRKRVSSCVCRGIASAYELNPLEGDPLLVLWPPESVLLSDLPEEGDNLLSAVVVSVREVYLIAEHHEPLVQLMWPKNQTFRCLLVFAVVNKCL